MEIPSPDLLAAKAASAATYGGAGGAIFGGINSNWVACVGGILIGVAGLLLNWYYKDKHYRLALARLSAVEAEL